MDIFDEADNILQDAQKLQKLEKIIEVLKRIIALHEQIFNAIGEHEKILMEALLGDNSTLTPSQEEIVKPLHFAPTQIQAYGDQLNAAREELRSLEKGE